MRKKLIPFEEALNRIGSLDFSASMTMTERALEKAAGAVLGEPMKAALPSPPFTNSAMDGFAYRHPGAPLPGSNRFPVDGTIYASDHVRCTASGHVHRIMTGAALPACADSVVPVEDCRESENRMIVEFEVPALAGKHVRVQGEDLKSKDLLYDRGTVLDSTSLLVLAGQGFSSVRVIAPPRIGILSTGSEITEPGEPLQPGMIYNSSGVFLRAEVECLALPLAFCRVLPDDRAATARAAAGANVDIIISTGGISMGEKDYIPEVLSETGYRILFHGVAMRPGQPNLLAAKPGGPCWIGLPGNPISTMVGFRFFFLPLLRRFYGLECREPGRVARLTHDPPRLKGKTRFYRGVMQEDEAGRALVTLDAFQASYAVGPTIRSNCFVRCDKEGSRQIRVFSFTGEI